MWWWRSLWSSWGFVPLPLLWWWRLDEEEDGLDLDFDLSLSLLLRWLDLLLVERTEASLPPLLEGPSLSLPLSLSLEDLGFLRLGSWREERSFREEEWSEEWDDCLPEDSCRASRLMPYARAARPSVCRISALSPDRREEGMVFG